MALFNFQLENEEEKRQRARAQGAANIMSPLVESYQQGLMQQPQIQQQNMQPSINGGIPTRTQEGYNVDLPKGDFVNRAGLMSAFMENAPNLDPTNTKILQGLMGAGKAQKPTNIMQNLVAAGYGKDTPEYQQAMKDYISKPSSVINMNTMQPVGKDAVNWINKTGQQASPLMNIEQLSSQGYSYQDPVVRKKIGEEGKVISSMYDAVDAYSNIVNKSGAMNVYDKYKNPEAYNKLVGAYTAVQLEYKNLAELGVLAGKDLELIENVIPDPTSITSNLQQLFAGKNISASQLKTVKSILAKAHERAKTKYGENWRDVIPNSIGLMGGSKTKTVKYGDLK